MIDLASIEYRVILLRENGEKWNITRLATELSWEESEGELASRITARFANEEVREGCRLSVFVKLNCYLIVQANLAGKWQEVTRGVVIDWETSDYTFTATCYDELFYLQQSEDNRYYSSGTKSRTAILGILEEWGIPLGEYKGPDISHGKMLFKADFLSDILLEILDEASRKEGKKYIIRAAEGKVLVLERGANEDIYVFDDRKNLLSARDHVSTANLVTRVKVLAKQQDDKRAKAEDTLDGSLEYGLRQRLVQRSGDESLSDAQASAREIMEEYGSPLREVAVETADLPTLRKGDKVRIISRGIGNYYYVKTVRHDAINRTMSMELEAVKGA